MGYVKWSYSVLEHFCHDVFRAFGFDETHHGKNVPVLNNSILHIPLLLLLWYSVLYIGIANF